MDTREERALRFSKIWKQSRVDAHKTQEFMADGIGVSKKTIRNWEKGVTAPDMFEGGEWFRVLGINPIPYLLSFLYPDIMDGISPTDEDSRIEEALNLLIKKTTTTEKRQLLYLMAGRHGSSWYSLLQMFTAHCHTTMQSRVAAARLILENYEMEDENDMLVCADNVRPDLELLRNAIFRGKLAVKKSNGLHSAGSQDNT